MIAAELAAFAIETSEFPQRVRAIALNHMFDGLGNSLGAIGERAAEPVLQVARGLGGPPESTIFGSDLKVSAPAAALANGSLIHALDFDDTHARGIVHATAVVLPAAFAVGQQVGATGRQVLDAAIIGYETACRVASAAPNGFHSRGIHATMVAGVFSSALVASRLMGLNAAQSVDALGIAGSQAGGLLAFLSTGSSTKQLHPGFASQSGILAARLAAAGASGPATVFDGPHGVFDALANGPIDTSVIINNLGSLWETEHIGIKPYPICQLSHATIDALLAARRSTAFETAEIDYVVAQVHPDSATVVCDASRDLTRPATPYAAKFSLPWCAAAVLLDGAITLDTFTTHSVNRPDVAELAARIRWDIAPGDVPAADAPGSVNIVLHNGERIVGDIARSEGGPDTPMSRDALVRKAAQNARKPLPGLVSALESCDELQGIDVILSALAHAAAI